MSRLLFHTPSIPPAEHPCGNLWPRMDRGFWPLKDHQKPEFHTERFMPEWLHHTMGRARGIDRDGIQQESRHFLTRDGHDRGMSQVISCAKRWFTVAPRQCQIFTRDIPFTGVPPFKVMMEITQGKRPLRPTYPTFTENLWTLILRCWDHDPHLRPEASEVLQALHPLSVSRSFRQSSTP